VTVNSKIRLPRLARTAAAVAMAAAIMSPLSAAAAMKCLTPAEEAAFQLRHLQSRLMLAGLACNQRDAYNTFVVRFRDELGAGGSHLITYFQQSGGPAALNRHVTEIANGAGLTRAEDPQAFCDATWRTFWELEQAPHTLPVHAATSLVPTVALPAACQTQTDLPLSLEASASDVIAPAATPAVAVAPQAETAIIPVSAAQ